MILTDSQWAAFERVIELARNAADSFPDLDAVHIVEEFLMNECEEE